MIDDVQLHFFKTTRNYFSKPSRHDTLEAAAQDTESLQSFGLSLSIMKMCTIFLIEAAASWP